MRLLSAIVRSYRIHRETPVDFADSLTLIGGKNESGKSTLTEAIHRALFLKATTGGKVQESMQSSIHAGHPEVEVQFEAAGKKWHLKKVFSKTSGKATLSAEGSVALQGADAEAKLSELMQVEEAGGGQGGAKKSLSQWAHLWVWQGSGGEDPSEHAASQRDALLSRLKEHGGGAVMQSDLDGRVANRFREECEAFFTRSGQIKAGSDLARAQSEKEKAETELENATEALARLEGAARDFQDAESILEGGEKNLAELSRQLEEARKKTKQVTELRHRAEIESRTHEEARKNHQQFRNAVEEWEQLESRVTGLKAVAAPGRETLSKLEGELRNRKKSLEVFADELENAENDLKQKREIKELAEAWGHLLKNREQLAGLEIEAKEIRELKSKRESIDTRLASLPKIDEATLRGLQQAESLASEAVAVLEAMSTGLEVLESNEDVKAGSRTLRKGDHVTLDRATDLTIGNSVRLQITPGGGTNLEEARESAKEKQEAKETAFRKAGVHSLEEAGNIRGQRSGLEADLQELLAALKQKDEDSLEKARQKASKEIATYEGEVERRSPSLPDFVPPLSLDEAKDRWESAKNELGPLEGRASEIKQKQAEARVAMEKAEQDRDKARDELARASQELVEAAALLKAKQEPLGSTEDRKKKETSLNESLAKAELSLTKTQESLEALQPDALDADISRLDRATGIKKTELETAGQKKAVARSILTLDGTIDPTAAVTKAQALADSARDRFQSLNRYAEAVRLLRDRFAEEQQNLSDRFSQPLAEKVTGYLRQIFGPGASAGVSLEDGLVGGWTMSRDSGTFEFSDLSGGTREQVAAAVRLALAEILAEDHGGCLPVVFDDAFTNSDPSRVQSLQRMLDLASRNGLQIILLTCDPDDYAGLGATTVSLTQP